MAFRTQRLANKFPKWSKLRRDPSSFGQRMLSVFADYFDYADVELKKVQDEFNLLKYALGKSFIWMLDLDSDDQMPVVVTTGGNTTWTYPTTVVGEHTVLGTQTLTRVDTLEDLLWGVPERIEAQEVVTVADFLIYDSTTGVISDIAYPERLQIVVSGSTEYFKRKQYRNPRASNLYYVIVEGLDANDLIITEYVEIQDDGFYWTRNILKEIISVKQEGFDGDVQIYLATAVAEIVDPYHLLSTDEVEGPAYLNLDISTGELIYLTKRFKFGSTYRQGTTPVVENDAVAWLQLLRNSVGATYTAVDHAVNWDSSRLYVVDNTGVVHVYNHGPGLFGSPSLESSLTTFVYIDIQPLKYYAALNETMTMFTQHEQIRHPIIGVEVKRITPAGATEYLQSNLTWGAGTWEFVPTVDIARKLPEDTWADLTFTSIFDEIGTWEFYCTTRVDGASTSVTYTGVMVDALDALVGLSTGVGAPTAIYFSETGELCVADATTVSKFSEHADVYLVNGPNQQLFMRENYTSVGVTL